MRTHTDAITRAQRTCERLEQERASGDVVARYDLRLAQLALAVELSRRGDSIQAWHDSHEAFDAALRESLPRPEPTDA